MRYTSDVTTSIALFTLLFATLASASASILGIDYGSEFIKAALVKPGIPIEIVLTKDSKRKEVAAVAFKPRTRTTPVNMSPERLYGTDAVNFAARYPDDVYPNLKQLLGVYSISDDGLQNYISRFPNLKITLSPVSGRSTVDFRSESSPEGVFQLEELIAMQLASVRRSGEALANDGNTITDCIITIPAYFTTEERYAMITAAEMAGMTVMELVSDGVAVGLNYAMTRSYTVDTKPEVHIIYDMGAGSTTATVIQVRGKSVKEGRTNKTVTDVSAIGVGFDRSLGGDAFNQKMFDLLLHEFEQSKAGQKLVKEEGKPISELLTGKQRAKLWKEAARIRHILSANTEAVSSIESLFPDVDFRSRKIQRAEFEELLSEFTVRITKPIIDAVDKMKGGLEGIDSVIIFGGASRVPFVQKVLADLLGDKISKNVNSDEAAVMGATFRGASLSKLFRVKDIRVQDVSSYNIAMRYKSEATGKELTQTLFGAPAWRGHTRIVPFKMTEDFTFDLYQVLGHPLIPDPALEEIFKVTTTNLTESIAKLKSTVTCLDNTLAVNVNIKIEEKYGLPEVTSGEVSCEYDEKKAGIVDDVKGFFGFGKDKDQKVLKDEESSSSKSGESSSTKTTKSKTKTKSAAPIPTGESGKPIESIPFGLKVERAGLVPRTPEELALSKKKLKIYDDDDVTRVKREEARNNLEAFTYRGSELLSADAFVAVSTEEQREALQEKISEVSDWIYTHEADIATRDILLGKLKELKNLEGPISHRRSEAEKRPEGVTRLEGNLKDGKKLVEKMKLAITKHERDITSWSSYSSSFVESVSSADAAASASAAAESSKSAEAASRSAEEASSATDAATKPSEDPLENLEDSSSSSTTSTSTKSTKTRTSKSTTKKPTPAPTVLYTLQDVKDLESSVEEAEKWLAEKKTAQEVLKAHEDPVLLSSDLKSQSESLEIQIRRLSGRTKANYTPPPPPKKPKKAVSKERKAKLDAAKKKLKLGEVDGIEGLEASVDEMLEKMSDMELEKMLENIEKEEAEKAENAGKEDILEDLKVERTEKHDEL